MQYQSPYDRLREESRRSLAKVIILSAALHVLLAVVGYQFYRWKTLPEPVQVFSVQLIDAEPGPVVQPTPPPPTPEPEPEPEPEPPKPEPPPPPPPPQPHPEA